RARGPRGGVEPADAAADDENLLVFPGGHGAYWRLRCHPRSAASTRSGVIGICVIGAAPSGRSASLIAFMTQPGAPAVPASPAPLAPSSESAVGFPPWQICMSGISGAIGTR